MPEYEIRVLDTATDASALILEQYYRMMKTLSGLRLRLQTALRSRCGAIFTASVRNRPPEPLPKNHERKRRGNGPAIGCSKRGERAATVAQKGCYEKYAGWHWLIFAKSGKHRKLYEANIV